jgi:hypothetical protein
MPACSFQPSAGAACPIPRTLPSPPLPSWCSKAERLASHCGWLHSLRDASLFSIVLLAPFGGHTATAAGAAAAAGARAVIQAILHCTAGAAAVPGGVGIASRVSGASSVSYPRPHQLYHHQQHHEGGPGDLMQLSQSLPSSLHQQPPWHKGPQPHQQQQQFRPQPQPLRRPHPAPPPLPRTRQDLRHSEGQLQQLVRQLEPSAEATAKQQAAFEWGGGDVEAEVARGKGVTVWLCCESVGYEQGQRH